MNNFVSSSTHSRSRSRKARRAPSKTKKPLEALDFCNDDEEEDEASDNGEHENPFQSASNALNQVAEVSLKAKGANLFFGNEQRVKGDGTAKFGKVNNK